MKMWTESELEFIEKHKNQLDKGLKTPEMLDELARKGLSTLALAIIYLKNLSVNIFISGYARDDWDILVSVDGQITDIEILLGLFNKYPNLYDEDPEDSDSYLTKKGESTLEVVEKEFEALSKSLFGHSINIGSIGVG